MAFPSLENGMITGRLTTEERQMIATRLGERGAPKACECCGAEQWSLGDYIISPQAIARHPTHFRLAPADPFFPTALLFCGNCGNTKQINLAILGMTMLFPTPESGPK